MKSILLVAFLAGIATASPILVAFGSLGAPGIYDITQNAGQSVSGVTIQYDPGGQVGNLPSPCAFDAGLGGTQFSLYSAPLPGCVGAQVDTTGVNGTTDGAYTLTFGAPAYQLQFSFGLFSSVSPTPPDTDFGITALFFDGVALTDVFMVPVAGQPLVCDGFGSCSGAFAYSGHPFTQVVMNFAPFSQPDPGSGLIITYGQSIATAYDMSYTAVPEPGTLLLLAFGLVGLGARRFVTRKA